MLGWDLDSPQLGVGDAVDLLRSAAALTGADSVMLTCDVVRGETVYVELRDGRLLVSDRGDTARYLDTGDGAHRRLRAEEIASVARAREADLVAVPDRWPHIVAPGATSVAEAVAVIGDAIESIFDAATTVPA